MKIGETAERAINDYGVTVVWKNNKYIEAEVSVCALAFALKQRPFFNRAKVKMEIERPYSKITPIGNNKDVSGFLDGNDVRLENSNGIIIPERKTPENFSLMAAAFF